MFSKPDIFCSFQRACQASMGHMKEATLEAENEHSIPYAQKKKQKYQKKLRKQTRNAYQEILNGLSVTDRHVLNFYNIIGINQRSFRMDGNDQSYFKTTFYIRSLEKIYVKQNFVIMKLTEFSNSQPPMQYWIKRFKSYGDLKFYNLAVQIEEISSVINQMPKSSSSSANSIEMDDENIDKVLKTYEDQPFVCKMSDKIIISNKLLDLLECDADEFILETTKFRVPLHEPTSTDKYSDVISHILNNIKMRILYLQGQITEEALVESSLLDFNDFIYTRRHKKMYCKMTAGMIHPLMSILKVNNVIYETCDDGRKTDQFAADLRKKVKLHCNSIREKEFDVLKHLTSLQINQLPQNTQRVAQYKEIA